MRGIGAGICSVGPEIGKMLAEPPASTQVDWVMATPPPTHAWLVQTFALAAQLAHRLFEPQTVSAVPVTQIPLAAQHPVQLLELHAGTP